MKAAVDIGKPVVTTVHGFLALRDWLTNLSQRAYLWSVGSWALRNSSSVICLTESDAREVASVGVRRRDIRIIPTAVDTAMFTPRGPKRETIVWLGRLVPEKGLETLLEAVATLRKKKNVPVLIVGDGPLRNTLIAQARALGIMDLVTFRFRADRFEVARMLSESRIFVLPSLKEGLPMILLEAMASANTVVASNLPPIVDALGDAGLYFTPGRSSDLASALSRALDDRESGREKGRLAHKIVQERFSWRVVLPLLDDLYEELVAR